MRFANRQKLALSHIPRLTKPASDFFNGKKHMPMNPDEAVPHRKVRTILYVDTSGNLRDLILLNVAPLSMGIETASCSLHVTSG
ncbi:hypothetical protein MJO28_005442 [Puccinia striiformis f. sp. tritici]|uniref:Uncharacterized protein n=4 Tax=Puccinia striiformis TaxID=27350 RepID=A0A0L0VGJ2_9BASI|nr:uncharacterized protein Pst134EA_032209 [Puccinia striiformis f. sp. tritici]KAI9611888.1 hypothetical protein H4Q26_007973 [Puccinia striiformis f. sp. tritici PST-130]KNE98341.1 hypothetical protein PSTG_08417 [Puccinia striiformis f. sp. tritici PST-78]POW16127.1 hypothetical protein PSTT_01583 [Puccinia striiformis]KAH9440783.1 hypothetical protein Pst134EA_032209 [Puccinia striiformis f. sp. tritici]KAH9458371.1 hypothetical protein Pst134EB_010673 [Puccinia striiformis f. sp. tritici]